MRCLPKAKEPNGLINLWEIKFWVKEKSCSKPYSNPQATQIPVKDHTQQSNQLSRECVKLKHSLNNQLSKQEKSLDEEVAKSKWQPRRVTVV